MFCTYMERERDREREERERERERERDREREEKRERERERERERDDMRLIVFQSNTSQFNSIRYLYRWAAATLGSFFDTIFYISSLSGKRNVNLFIRPRGTLTSREPETSSHEELGTFSSHTVHADRLSTTAQQNRYLSSGKKSNKATKNLRTQEETRLLETLTMF